MANSAFVPSVLAIGGGGAGGAGELNLVSNPAAASGTTGWAAGTSHTVAVAGSVLNSPLNPTVTTAFDLSSTAAVSLGSQTSTSGVYDALTMPTGLQNRKLKVEFYYTTPASSLGTWAVAVYKGATRVPLSTDAAGDTLLPAGTTGKFVAYFDTDSSSSYSLNLVQRTRTSANSLYITQVVVGPGIQPQGAVVGEWQSYTPTVSTGTWTNSRGYYQRVGSTLHLKIYAGPITANGSGLYTWPLPTGLTADLAALGASGVTPVIVDADSGNNTYVQVGTAAVAFQGGVWYMDGTTGSNLNDARAYLASSTTIAVVGGSGTNANRGNGLGSADNLTSVSGVVQIEARIPIAEWAGSGTVQLAQNDVEYAASTSGTWDAAASAAQTVYGPAGAPITGALSASRTKVVQFQSPIQPGDKLTLEYQYASGGPWTDATLSNVPFTNMATVAFGACINGYPATNQAQVPFQLYAISGSSFNTNTGATPWGSAGTPVAWRVRKSSAGAAVGFGNVAKDQAGLLPAYNTNLDDATATRLGLKQYIYTTDASNNPTSPTYNGVIRPSLSCTQAGFYVAKAMFLPYQCQDGTWRLKISFVANYTLASPASLTITVTGIVFPTFGSQPLAGFLGSNTNYVRLYTDATGTGNILMTGGVGTSNSVYVAGDIELTAKPTWAYS